MRVKNKTLALTLTAVFTALTAVTTMFVLVPDPSTKGYVNVGDAIIFVTGVLFGPASAAFAGGIGSMLADVILGYAVWAPYTLVIKALEGFICGLLAHRLFSKRPETRFTVFAVICAMLAAATEMVTLYFFSGWIMQGSAAAALASVPSNLIQAGLSLAVASVLIFGTGLGKHAKRALGAKLETPAKKRKADGVSAAADVAPPETAKGVAANEISESDASGVAASETPDADESRVSASETPDANESRGAASEISDADESAKDA